MQQNHAIFCYIMEISTCIFKKLCHILPPMTQQQRRVLSILIFLSSIAFTLAEGEGNAAGFGQGVNSPKSPAPLPVLEKQADDA